jgi:hypothetical protein
MRVTTPVALSQGRGECFLSPSSVRGWVLPRFFDRPSSDLVCLQGMREAYEVLRWHANQPPTWTVHIRYEEERNREGKG